MDARVEKRKSATRSIRSHVSQQPAKNDITVDTKPCEGSSSGSRSEISQLTTNGSERTRTYSQKELKRIRVLVDKLTQKIGKRDKEIRILKDCIDYIQAVSQKKSNYYYELVWFARRTNEQLVRFRPSFVKDMIKEYGPSFRGEIKRLCSPTGGDWQHGFNSGCLAMSRLFVNLSNVLEPIVWDDDFTESVDQQRLRIMEEFPMLDT